MTETVERRLPVNRAQLIATFGEPTGFTAAEVEQATAKKETALLSLGASGSPMAASVLGKCYYHVPTAGVDTQAVTLMADGTTAYLFNPGFVNRLDDSGNAFVLHHEALHVMYAHLRGDRERAKDPLWTTAVEAGINQVVMVRLNRGMPMALVVDESGQPVLDEQGREQRVQTGIDPQEVYRLYVEDLRKQGLTPLSLPDFYETDEACYRELKRMTTPPNPGQPGGGSENGDPSGSQAGSANSPQSGAAAMGCSHADAQSDVMDEATADIVGSQVLRTMMTQALRGDAQARSELLDLAKHVGEEGERLSKLWGDLGLGRLRGETLATRRVDWWQQWISNSLASRVLDDARLGYAKKRGGVDLMLGLDPVLQYRLPGEERLVLVAYDTSGSMPDRVLKYLAQLAGHTDGVKFIFVAFDGAITTFVPGEPVLGGGGTNFALVQEYAEGRLAIDGEFIEDTPDAILVATDGYAPPISPAEPDKWVWLITEHGTTDWLERQGEMEYHRVTTGDGV